MSTWRTVPSTFASIVDCRWREDLRERSRRRLPGTRRRGTACPCNHPRPGRSRRALPPAGRRRLSRGSAAARASRDSLRRPGIPAQAAAPRPAAAATGGRARAAGASPRAAGRPSCPRRPGSAAKLELAATSPSGNSARGHSRSVSGSRTGPAGRSCGNRTVAANGRACSATTRGSLPRSRRLPRPVHGDRAQSEHWTRADVEVFELQPGTVQPPIETVVPAVPGGRTDDGRCRPEARAAAGRQAAPADRPPFLPWDRRGCCLGGRGRARRSGQAFVGAEAEPE